MPQNHTGHKADCYNAYSAVSKAVKGEETKDIKIQGEEFESEPDGNPRIGDKKDPEKRLTPYLI